MEVGNNVVGKDGEVETTSKAENKCQPETKLENATSGMQNIENQETAKVMQDNLDKEKCVENNLDTQKGVEDSFDAKQKGESLEMPCSNEETVQTEVKENSKKTRGNRRGRRWKCRRKTWSRRRAAEKMNELNEDFERKSQAVETDLSAETNIVGAWERLRQREWRRPITEKWLKRWIGWTKKNLKENLNLRFHLKNGSSAETTSIAGENAVDERVENHDNELASANVQSCSRNT